MDHEFAEVLRGDGRWKRDRRHVHVTGKSETACEYLASLMVAMLSDIKRQMILDGVISTLHTSLFLLHNARAE